MKNEAEAMATECEPIRVAWRAASQYAVDCELHANGLVRPFSHRLRSRPERRSTTQSNTSLYPRTGLPRSLRSLTLIAIVFVLITSHGVHATSSAHAEEQVQLLLDSREPPMLLSHYKPLTLTRRGLDSDRNLSSDSTDLPSPFDSNLGNNFTSSTCPKFFETFLHDPFFKACLPLSLLLQTSSAFFAATRSTKELSTILNFTCNVPYANCSSLMSNYASQIQSSSACGADLRAQNPMAQQAYAGFSAYQPLYHAGCLKDDEGRYCFVDAATNTTAPTSSYVYYLPLGMALPSVTRPTCNRCLRRTMDDFAAYADDSNQPMSSNYAAAVEQIGDACGSGFLRVSNQTSPISTSFASGLEVWPGGLALLVSIASFLYVLL